MIKFLKNIRKLKYKYLVLILLKSHNIHQDVIGTTFTLSFRISCILETPNLLTCSDSSTNTKTDRNERKKKKKKTHVSREPQTISLHQRKGCNTFIGACSESWCRCFSGLVEVFSCEVFPLMVPVLLPHISMASSLQYNIIQSNSIKYNII